MSRHVANLTQAGYLLKTPDLADGRVSWVELTDRAKDTIERLETERRQVLSKVFSDWTRSDRDAFVDLLDRFSSGLAHHAEHRRLTDRFRRELMTELEQPTHAG